MANAPLDPLVNMSINALIVLNLDTQSSIVGSCRQTRNGIEAEDSAGKMVKKGETRVRTEIDTEKRVTVNITIKM